MAVVWKGVTTTEDIWFKQARHDDYEWCDVCLTPYESPFRQSTNGSENVHQSYQFRNYDEQSGGVIDVCDLCAYKGILLLIEKQHNLR